MRRRGRLRSLWFAVLTWTWNRIGFACPVCKGRLKAVLYNGRTAARCQGEDCGLIYEA